MLFVKELESVALAVAVAAGIVFLSDLEPGRRKWLLLPQWHYYLRRRWMLMGQNSIVRHSAVDGDIAAAAAAHSGSQLCCLR